MTYLSMRMREIQAEDERRQNRKLFVNGRLEPLDYDGGRMSGIVYGIGGTWTWGADRELATLPDGWPWGRGA